MTFKNTGERKVEILSTYRKNVVLIAPSPIEVRHFYYASRLGGHVRSVLRVSVGNSSLKFRMSSILPFVNLHSLRETCIRTGNRNSWRRSVVHDHARCHLPC